MATTTMKATEEEKKPDEKTAALERPTTASQPKQPETSQKAQQQQAVKDTSQWPEPKEAKAPSDEPVMSAVAPAKKRSGPGSAPWAAVVNSEAVAAASLSSAPPLLPSSSAAAADAGVVDVNEEGEAAQTVRHKYIVESLTVSY